MVFLAVFSIVTLSQFDGEGLIQESGTAFPSFADALHDTWVHHGSGCKDFG